MTTPAAAAVKVRADQPHISRRRAPISTAVAGQIVGQTEARKREHSRWPGLGGLSTAPSPVPLLLGSPTESCRSLRTRPSRNALGAISAVALAAREIRGGALFEAEIG